jgi:hypothetical protein
MPTPYACQCALARCSLPPTPIGWPLPFWALISRLSCTHRVIRSHSFRFGCCVYDHHDIYFLRFILLIVTINISRHIVMFGFVHISTKLYGSEDRIFAWASILKNSKRLTCGWCYLPVQNSTQGPYRVTIGFEYQRRKGRQIITNVARTHAWWALGTRKHLGHTSPSKSEMQLSNLVPYGA